MAWSEEATEEALVVPGADAARPCGESARAEEDGIGSMMWGEE